MGEAISWEEKYKLWELQLTDLQYQKRELDLELKLKEIMCCKAE